MSTSVFRRIRRIPYLFAGEERQLRLFWKILQKNLKAKDINFGIYEEEKFLHADFRAEENGVLSFFYGLNGTRLRVICDILEYEGHEDVSSMFILAQHLNNLIGQGGKVQINTSEQSCKLVYNVDFRPYLFDLADLNDLINLHFEIASDVHKCFRRLLQEGEDPVVIIADLLSESEE